MIPLPSQLVLKLILGIGCLAFLALLVGDRNHWKARAAHHAELLAGERAAHSATVANYRAAAERARRQDLANAARVKDEQAEINERIGHEFEIRIAAARAAAGRLRDAGETAATNRGIGGAAPLSGLSAAAEGAAQVSNQNRLPRSERLIATEQAIQLDELIKWVRQQAEVDVSRD